MVSTDLHLDTSWKIEAFIQDALSSGHKAKEHLWLCLPIDLSWIVGSREASTGLSDLKRGHLNNEMLPLQIWESGPLCGSGNKLPPVQFLDRCRQRGFGETNGIYSLISRDCVWSHWWPALRLGLKVKVVQSCPILCDPMDYIVHGILQARILEWVAVPFSRGSSQTRD